MRRKTGLLAAGAALIMMVGTSGAAIASASESSASTKGPAKVTNSAKATPGKWTKEKADALAELAKRYRVSLTRLENALRQVKPLLGRNGGDVSDPALVQTFAKGVGVSTPEARKILTEVFGSFRPDKPGMPITVQSLAKVLGVSVAKARIALDGLVKLSRMQHGVDPLSKEFALLAKEVGVSPQQLVKAIDQLKTGTAKGVGR